MEKSTENRIAKRSECLRELFGVGPEETTERERRSFRRELESKY